MSAPLTPLCTADDASFWPWRTWTDFARLSPAEKLATTVIVPVAGMADWGLGHPLDAEELVLMHVIKSAVQAPPAGFVPLVIPPLRFVLGPAASGAFAVDPPTAHALLREVALSIHASGFRRLILFNASPWNEELCAAASRDLRIELGLQVFRINLGHIGLDFHPTRSTNRREVQTVVTCLTGRLPEPGPAVEPTTKPRWGDETVVPLAGPGVPLDRALIQGAELLAATKARVLSLFGEIAAYPPLPRGGALATQTPP